MVLCSLLKCSRHFEEDISFRGPAHPCCVAFKFCAPSRSKMTCLLPHPQSHGHCSKKSQTTWPSSSSPGRLFRMTPACTCPRVAVSASSSLSVWTECLWLLDTTDPGAQCQCICSSLSRSAWVLYSERYVHIAFKAQLVSIYKLQKSEHSEVAIVFGGSHLQGGLTTTFPLF